MPLQQLSGSLFTERFLPIRPALKTLIIVGKSGNWVAWHPTEIIRYRHWVFLARSKRIAPCGKCCCMRANKSDSITFQNAHCRNMNVLFLQSDVGLQSFISTKPQLNAKGDGSLNAMWQYPPKEWIDKASFSFFVSLTHSWDTTSLYNRDYVIYHFIFGLSSVFWSQEDIISSLRMWFSNFTKVGVIEFSAFMSCNI